jgi:hypothetical protein
MENRPIFSPSPRLRTAGPRLHEARCWSPSAGTWSCRSGQQRRVPRARRARDGGSVINGMVYLHTYTINILYIFFSFSSQWVQRPVLSCSIRLNVSPLAGNLAKRSWKSWLQNDMQHSPANACPALRAGPMVGEQPPRCASS